LTAETGSPAPEVGALGVVDAAGGLVELGVLRAAVLVELGALCVAVLVELAIVALLAARREVGELPELSTTITAAAMTASPSSAAAIAPVRGRRRAG
jgi:hypothetical protein